MMDLGFSNARVVADGEMARGSMLVRAGRVESVDFGSSRVGEDFEGDLLLPGIIDLHTDNLEKHYFPRPNIDWDPASAAIVHDGLCASVGVTTVYDSLSLGAYSNAARTEDNLAHLVLGLEQALQSKQLKIDHRLHWRCELTASELGARLDRFVAHPRTGLLSLMDHTPGQRQYKNIDRFLKTWRSEGASDRDIEERLASARARQAEWVAPNRKLVSRLAADRSVPLAAHDDETEEHVDLAAAAGATIAEFPVTMGAAKRSRAHGMAIVMGGPNLIRGGSYSGNIGAQEVAECGLLDGFASDYVPRSLIECAFRLTEAPFFCSIAQAWETVSGAPARALGLADRGALAQRLRADFIRVALVEGRPIVRGVWVEGRRVA